VSPAWDHVADGLGERGVFLGHVRPRTALAQGLPLRFDLGQLQVLALARGQALGRELQPLAQSAPILLHLGKSRVRLAGRVLPSGTNAFAGPEAQSKALGLGHGHEQLFQRALEGVAVNFQLGRGYGGVDAGDGEIQKHGNRHDEGATDEQQARADLGITNPAEHGGDSLCIAKFDTRIT